MDCVDLPPVILVGLGLGNGWAAFALGGTQAEERGACPGLGPFLVLGRDKKGISGKESSMSSPGAVTVVWAVDPGALRVQLPPLVSTQPPWKGKVLLFSSRQAGCFLGNGVQGFVLQ